MLFLLPAEQDNSRSTALLLNHPSTPPGLKHKRALGKLQARLSRARKKLRKFEQGDQKKLGMKALLNSLDEYLPPKSVNFFKNQIKNCQKSPRGVRFAEVDKLFALRIWFHSRSAYHILRQLLPSLPSKSTLIRQLRSTAIYPGFQGQVFDALKVKVSAMAEADKQCVLIFDEMSLKSDLTYNSHDDYIEGLEDFGDFLCSPFVANHALAFMVRGLQDKWKQPVGYFLTSGAIGGDKLLPLVKTCIDKLQSIGLTIKAVICDQGSNNRKCFETLGGVSVEKPYFLHNDCKVHVIYDPPHLLKNVRNNLKKSGFTLDGKPVKWQHIEDFYNLDKDGGGIRLAPKLTANHIDIKPFAAMRVNLAAQVLSHSVAAGIYTLADLGKLPAEAKTTAEFVENFDQLFNAMNSKCFKSSQKMRHAFSENSGHTTFLKDSLTFVGTIVSRRDLPCIQGWKISIQSVLSLWEDLHNNHNFKFLLTNRLNQDCAENLFCQVRSMGGCRDNPSPQQFRAAFRHIVFDKIMCQSKASNCEIDMDKVLLDLTTLKDVHKSVPTETVADKLAGIELIHVFAPPADIAKQNVAAYMAGYLLRKLKISCSVCKEQFILRSLPNNPKYVFLKNKAYVKEGGLVYPSEIVVQFVENLELVFNRAFEGVMHLRGVLRRLCVNAEEVPVCNSWMLCNEKHCVAKVQSMMALYMKVRVHHALKMSNKEDKNKGKRNRKYLKLAHM